MTNKFFFDIQIVITLTTSNHSQTLNNPHTSIRSNNNKKKTQYFIVFKSFCKPSIFILMSPINLAIFKMMDHYQTKSIYHGYHHHCFFFPQNNLVTLHPFLMIFKFLQNKKNATKSFGFGRGRRWKRRYKGGGWSLQPLGGKGVLKKRRV